MMSRQISNISNDKTRVGNRMGWRLYPPEFFENFLKILKIPRMRISEKCTLPSVARSAAAILPDKFSKFTLIGLASI